MIKHCLIPFIPLLLACFSAYSQTILDNNADINERQSTKLIDAINITLSPPLKPEAELRSLWDRHSYSLDIQTNLLNQNIYHLTPLNNSRSGGEFKLLSQTHTKILFQAPHQYYDKHTGQITKAVSELIPGSSLFINTMHRKKIDLAKDEESLFYRITEHYIDNIEHLKIIQIHGFNNKKRESIRAQTANIIVSSGSTILSSLHYRLVSCLRRKVSKLTYLYPQEVSELGGKENIVGIRASESSSTSFFHIELSLKQRRDLINNTATLVNFSQCISSP